VHIVETCTSHIPIVAYRQRLGFPNRAPCSLLTGPQRLVHFAMYM
jgi:hypothetical protein